MLITSTLADLWVVHVLAPLLVRQEPEILEVLRSTLRLKAGLISYIATLDLVGL